jgi:hypothetical protein
VNNVLIFMLLFLPMCVYDMYVCIDAIPLVFGVTATTRVVILLHCSGHPVHTTQHDGREVVTQVVHPFNSTFGMFLHKDKRGITGN